MSIEIKSPSIALNSDDWDIRNYRMDVTMEIGSKENITEVFKKVAKNCKMLKDTKPGTLTLIINCHGYYREVPDGFSADPGGVYAKKKLIPGFGLALGTGIRQENASVFGKIAPYVDRIIITACGAAGIGVAGSSDGDGNLLCSALAQYAQAPVKCSQSVQSARLFIREDPGYIDDWEGVVLTYGPDGSVIAVERHA